MPTTKDTISKQFDQWVRSLSNDDPVKKEIALFLNVSTPIRNMLERVFMGGIESELRNQLAKVKEETEKLGVTKCLTL